jgi:RNA polymerase sigma factor (TIGR02999 family)
MVRDDSHGEAGAGNEPDRSQRSGERVNPVRQTHDVTLVLSQIEQGDPSAAEQLLPLVYEELRKLAAARMVQEHPGQTLQATALVHEAYIRLVDVEKAQHWDSRGHFYAAAAEAMRRILVDCAREKGAQKSGGDLRRIELHEDLVSDGQRQVILEVNAALKALEANAPDAAALVKLRYFAGFSHGQAAEAMGISRRAADRLWVVAKTWLYREISD